MLASYQIKHVDGSNEFIDYPMHDCTEEDFAHFYSYDDESFYLEKNWETLLQMKIKDTLKCLSKKAYEEVIMKPNGI